jgi:hypothetical protein
VLGRPPWRATSRGLRSLAEAADALQAVRVSRSKQHLVERIGNACNSIYAT